MSSSSKSEHQWSKLAKEYDPIKCGSIDGTDKEAHDRAIIRATNSNYTPNERVVGDPLCTIFVGRLHIKTNEETLKRNFEKFGKIVRCRIVRDLVTGISRCYGFIEYEKSGATRYAIRDMQNAYIDNCEIVVENECERELKGWKPRRLGGGFGGRRESGQLRFGGRARPFQKPLDVKSALDIKDAFRYQKYKNKHET